MAGGADVPGCRRESGKRLGNETIRITSTGQVSIRLPAALGYLANAPHGRYVLDTTVEFQHRGEEWADRISANSAVAYRIHHDPVRRRWYVTASWRRPAVPVLPIDAALANAGDQRAQHRSEHAAEHEPWQQGSLPLSL
ncbi:hypothetical protein AB0E64_04590 [Streptomyces caelestis]|uniref:Uncharacterized protein n=1 Tax=Streptomyces caelestis TaxID=36816 RepID=A0A7W9H5V2_9ACTN|nr:hypothetical protein [Streptomyces caelestis]MBB5796170.1 hypothetical protein [Streptomyces caelestis]GGW43030.1 hypothetical protein GCM10010320_23930 [Streptomyces caelestis]